MYTAIISVDQDIDYIEKCFQGETGSFNSKRSSYIINKNRKKLEFKIKADDATALRATFNSIVRNLSIFEKVKKVM